MRVQQWADTLISMKVQSPADAELLGQIQRVSPDAMTNALLRLARILVGDELDCDGYSAKVLGICQVFAQEGALVQEMAGEIAEEVSHA